MLAVFKLNEPMEIEATMSLTMPLKDWVALGLQLNDAKGFPTSALKSAVDDLVYKAKEHFTGTYEKRGYNASVRLEE